MNMVLENNILCKDKYLKKKPCAFFFIWKWVEYNFVWNCPSDNDDYDL